MSRAARRRRRLSHPPERLKPALKLRVGDDDVVIPTKTIVETVHWIGAYAERQAGFSSEHLLLDGMPDRIGRWVYAQGLSSLSLDETVLQVGLVILAFRDGEQGYWRE